MHYRYPQIRVSPLYIDTFVSSNILSCYFNVFINYWMFTPKQCVIPNILTNKELL